MNWNEMIKIIRNKFDLLIGVLAFCCVDNDPDFNMARDDTISKT